MIPQTVFTRGPHVFPRKLIYKKNVLSKEICEEIKTFSLGPNSGWHDVVNRTPKYWDIKFKTCRIPLNVDLGLNQILTPIWEEAFDYFKFELSHIEQYEIKEYYTDCLATEHPDQFYGTHGEAERKLTMIIQLSDDGDYTGGDTLITRNPFDRSLGSMAIFPSFFPHEITKVTSGSRWSLNCWAWGPYWK